MITITNNAADEIKLSAYNPETKDLFLRLAIDIKDNTWKYLMGFDEIRGDSDICLESAGIKYVVAYEQKDLLTGTTIDFDEINKKDGYSFIFLNPNDPNFIPPTE